MNLIYGLVEETYKCMWGVDLPDDGPIFEGKHMDLITGQNDWAAFQVLLRADEDFTVSVSQNPIFTPVGSLPNVRLKAHLDGLPDENISMQLIDYVEDDDRVYKADILLNNESKLVKGHITQPVWIEVKVPDDMEPGKYMGRVDIYTHTMFEPEEKIDTLTFQIEVFGVKLPSIDGRKFHLDLWQHNSNIARKHEVDLWSDAHFRVMERYIESLSELGQKAVTIIASEIPWSGQRSFKVTNYLSDLFEYSMVRVYREEDGSFSYDFSVVERYIDLCFSYNIDREIEVFGLTNIWVDEAYGYGAVADDYPDAIRIRYLDKRDGTYRYMDKGAYIDEYIKALEQFFIDKDLIDKVLIVADEPADIELYKQRLSRIKKVAPSFKYKTAINHIEFIREFKDEITDFVPVLPHVCAEWDLLNELKQDIEGRLLWYVCCWPPIPNTFISSPLIESRLIGILTAFMDFDGFLRWNYTVWPENPRERISFRYPNWKAGDTNFVYPAPDGTPLVTLRYKNLKRGIEDFELIEMLKDIHPSPQEVIDRIWEGLIAVEDMKEFITDGHKKAEDLYSLEHRDYDRMKMMVMEEIQRYI